MKNMKQNNFLCNCFFSLFFIFCSCDRAGEFETSEELKNYLENEENGYVIYKEIGGIDFNLLYKPTDLMVLDELENINDKYTLSEVYKLREKYSQYIYVILSMSKENKSLLNILGGDKYRYGEFLNKLSFSMDDVVSLYNEKRDTLPLLSHVNSRFFEVSQADKIIFAFSRDSKIIKGDNLFFVIKDFGFNTGDLKFKLPVKNIINEPTFSFRNNFK